MKTINEIIVYLRTKKACKDSIKWLSEYSDPLKVLDECENGTWLELFARKVNIDDQDKAVKTYLTIEKQAWQMYLTTPGIPWQTFDTIRAQAWQTYKTNLKIIIRRWIKKEK